MTTSSPWPQEDIEKPFSWDKDKESQLRKLWNSGDMSASVIGAEMGITRNAVIGKAKRMNLRKKDPNEIVFGKMSKQPRPIANSPTIKKETRVKREKPATAPEKGALRFVFGPHRIPVPKDPRPLRKMAWEALPGSMPVDLMKRTGCAWPISNGETHLYCNLSKDGKGPYCSEHAALAYRKVEK